MIEFWLGFVLVRVRIRYFLSVLILSKTSLSTGNAAFQGPNTRHNSSEHQVEPLLGGGYSQGRRAGKLCACAQPAVLVKEGEQYGGGGG